MSQRYASKTTVPIARSEAQLKELLRRYGASRIATLEEDGRAAVAFTMSGHNVRLELRLPPHSDFAKTETGKKRDQKATHSAWEQSCRSRWRLLVLLTQAKLEAIEDGSTTFVREFMADIILPSGETFSQAVESGRLNKQLGGGSGVPLLPSGGSDQ